MAGSKSMHQQTNLPTFLTPKWVNFGFFGHFLHFFFIFLEKSLEVMIFCVPLQSQTKRTRLKCGSSSVGRAQPCQGWGREFEPRLPLQKRSAEMLTLYYENLTRRGTIIFRSSFTKVGFFLFIVPLSQKMSMKTCVLMDIFISSA